jgi:hypothetical protein
MIENIELGLGALAAIIAAVFIAAGFVATFAHLVVWFWGITS